MKIAVPEYVVKHQLSDREMVFLSFMLYLTKREGRKTEFFFISADVKHILGCLQATNPELYIGNLRKVLRIGIMSWDTWMCILNPSKEEIAKNGAIMQTYYEITDPEAINIFHYLAGRCTDSEVLMDYDGLREHETRGARTKRLMDGFFSQSIKNEA